jgi:hypothetical protein
MAPTMAKGKPGGSGQCGCPRLSEDHARPGESYSDVSLRLVEIGGDRLVGGSAACSRRIVEILPLGFLG